MEGPEHPEYILPHSAFGDPECCGVFFPIERGDSARRGKLVSFASPEEHLEIVISGKG
jgi:hypothetical protein